MNRAPLLLTLMLSTTLAQAPAPATPPAVTPRPATVTVPRDKVTLSCADMYFRSVRENFPLADETHPRCTSH